MTRFIFLILFSLTLTLFSQENNSFSDSLYFESMNDKLSLKLDIDNDIESFKFTDANNSFFVTPNIDFKTGLSVHYRFISFKISYAPNILSNNDNDLKGKTKSFKFQTDLYIKNWVQTLEYAKTKGYYLSEFKSIDNEGLPDDSKYLILPDLETITYRGTTRYKFNPNFSFKALTTQTEIQRKSAGSFAPGLTYKYSEINNKMTQQDLSTFSLVLHSGYYHTFVINHKWFSGLGVAPGLGMEFNKIIWKTEDFTNTNRDHDFVLNLDTTIGIGYNSNNFFSGAYLNFMATTRRDNQIIQFDTFRSHFQIFIGYRFKAPKFAKESVDWIEEKSPIN